MKTIKSSYAICLFSALTFPVGPASLATTKIENSEYSKMIQSLKSTDAVLIYVIPASVFFRRNLNADRLRQVACRYKITESGKARSVLATILSSNPPKFSSEARSVDFRVGLEIGDRKMFLEDGKFFGPDKKEMHVQGQFQESPFTANARLVDDIRNIVMTRDFEQLPTPDRFCTKR